MNIRMKFMAFLGVSLLCIWLLSLLSWLYIAIGIIRSDIAVYWYLGLIAFVTSFTCLAMYLTFWWRSGSKSLPSRFARASLLTTWLYSLLLFGYLVARVVINQAPLGAPFIDTLLPWFTFLRLGIITLAIGILSFFAYLALFWRPRPSLTS